jgi:hypothetical protein
MTVREQLVRWFESVTRKREPKETLGDSVYAMLRSTIELGLYFTSYKSRMSVWTRSPAARVARLSAQALGGYGMYKELLSAAGIGLTRTLRFKPRRPALNWAVRENE